METLLRKLASLGALELEELHGGAEATAVIKLSARCSLVVKTIQPRLAAEEVAQLERINSALPGLCPAVVHSEASRGIYVTEFAQGETLEQRLRGSVDDVTSAGHFDLAVSSLLALRNLHKTTQRRYASGYHGTIVTRRLATILQYTFTTEHVKRFSGRSVDAYYHSARSTGFSRNRSLGTVLARAGDHYLAFLPETESLIHGDPHLGNIIVTPTRSTFIDPRVTWDEDPNPNQGYFDPLYDVACIAHSILANLILLRPHALLESVESRRTLIGHAIRLLDVYTTRNTTRAQFVRFLTYLICSLSGNLKYARWTPTTDALWLTLNFLDLIEDQYDRFPVPEGVVIP